MILKVTPPAGVKPMATVTQSQHSSKLFSGIGLQNTTATTSSQFSSPVFYFTYVFLLLYLPFLGSCWTSNTVMPVVRLSSKTKHNSSLIPHRNPNPRSNPNLCSNLNFQFCPIRNCLYSVSNKIIIQKKSQYVTQCVVRTSIQHL